MKPRVFVTRELFPDVIEKLGRYYDVEVWDRYQPPPYDVLLEKAREVDALVSLLSDRIDCNLLKQAKRLRIVAQYAVGYDNIDVECATNLGIYVTNTPGVLTEATAELTWALILAVARRIVESDVFVRWGEWWRTRTGWHPHMMLGAELKGKTLGVVGLGRIGSRVAEIGKAFGMKIIYYDVKRNVDLEKALGAEYRDLDTLLQEADVVSIHVPLTKETHHMINEERLKKMKKTAILVNTARGAIIDTNALVKALTEGWIAGAGLDVFEQEPLPPNHPLTSFKNVVLVPHIGSATYEARHAMAELVAENLIAFYEGREPPTLVNREVLRVRPPGFK
ncbi:glyoxylate reductase [Ignisphaera sp. 4213-co]|uniref:Glyoxylate reductase n=1 Tax=Ignisphaera cupida TaxID=3050454 RepID=A0ABD4Z920_9CREN|nr:glyoxylate reductase [Ignisphaera sp. 4213-co]MDK6029400.1 glyoxylate reductase [Ignisphaera sp. 4213-co]